LPESDSKPDPAPNYGHHATPLTKQEVVPIDIVPGQHTASQMQQMYLDNLQTIEADMKNLTIRISKK